VVSLAASAGSISLFAQLQNNTEKQLTCNNNNGDRDRARHCEVRELSVASIGRLSIDSSPNGGISIKGCRAATSWSAPAWRPLPTPKAPLPTW
jgi:hypothetical protein